MNFLGTFSFMSTIKFCLYSFSHSRFPSEAPAGLFPKIPPSLFY